MANGDYRVAGDFFHLIMAGKWEHVFDNCSENRDNIGLRLTKTEDNVIHLAVSRGETGWLQKLLGIASMDTIQRQNKEGDTPLHLAAMRGDRRMCDLLCRGRITAVTVPNISGETPMYLASVVGEMGSFNFLLGEFMKFYSEPVPLVSWDQMNVIQKESFNAACMRNDKDTILHASIRGEFIDLAYIIFEQFRHLAIIKNNAGETPIHLLAKLPSSFKSGYRPGIFKSLAYNWVQINVPALNEISESSQTENEARIQNDVSVLNEISESSQLETEASILPGVQINVPALNEISESSQIENEARIQNDVSVLNEISESSQLETEASILPGVQINVPALSEISESSQTENEARIQNDVSILNEISKSSQLETEARILPGFRVQATSMRIISWFRQAQWGNRIKFMGTKLISLGRVLHNTFTMEEVMKEKRKHALSNTMVKEIIEYLKQQPGENQSNPWMRAGNATTNPSEATVANSNTSEEAGASNPSEETDANRNTSGEASTSNPSEETGVHRNALEEPVANNTEEETYIDAPIVSAVKMGITEMVSMIVQSFPFTVEEVDRKGKNLFFLAAESRQPQVLQLLLKLNIRQTLVTEKLEDGKNVLHVAAELQKDHHPWSIISGAPLQMHLEVKWFELVKALMPSQLQLSGNNKGEKPNEVFIKTHEKLVGEGLEWLSSTSKSCTAISSLLTTAALATAATVPGGVNQHGVPNLRDEWRFNLFIIAALATLCFGVLSLVMFLVILSSRSDVKNFKVGLPRKLMYGLITLYCSLSTMLLAFCIAQSFAIHGGVRYVAYASYAILALSIIYLVIEQFPLFFDFISFAKLQNWSNN